MSSPNSARVLPLARVPVERVRALSTPDRFAYLATMLRLKAAELEGLPSSDGYAVLAEICDEARAKYTEGAR